MIETILFLRKFTGHHFIVYQSIYIYIYIYYVNNFENKNYENCL